MMFKLENNVPAVYIKESRDFQLLCRLYDIANNAVRYDVNNITHMIDPLLADVKMLPLLATRVGFFPRHEIDSIVLRYIISAFQEIVRKKGTKSAIEQAVWTVLKAENDKHSYYIEIEKSTKQINIYAGLSDVNKVALDELLAYVLPVGFTYTLYNAAAYLEPEGNRINNKGAVDVILGPNRAVSGVIDNKTSVTDILKLNTPKVTTPTDSTALTDASLKRINTIEAWSVIDKSDLEATAPSVIKEGKISE